MSMHSAMPNMDCLQSHRKTTNVWPFTNHRCTKFHGGILWAKHIENWLDEQLLRAKQIVIFSTPNAQNHAHKPICFPSARQDVMGRPRSTFWRGRPGASLRAWRGLTEVGNRIPQPYSVSLKPSETAGGKQPYSEKCPHSSTKKMTRKVRDWTTFQHRLGTVKHQLSSRSKNKNDYKHMPKQHGNIEIFHSNPHAISCGNMEVDIQKWRYVIRTPWSHMKVVSQHAHCQTRKHQADIQDETWNCNFVVSSVWVPVFAYALFVIQWGTDLRHVKVAPNKWTNRKHGMSHVNARPRPQPRLIGHRPENRIWVPQFHCSAVWHGGY